MKIGILSECQRQDDFSQRIPFWRKSPCGIEMIDEQKNGFLLTAVQLPYTLYQLKTVSEKKRTIALRRACDILISQGISRAVYTKEMKQIFSPRDAVNIQILQEGELFYHFLPGVLRRLTKKYQLDRLSARLGISDTGLSLMTQRLMNELRYDARYMQLYTSNIEQGEDLSVRFSDEFGVPVTVAQTENMQYCDILIDLDKKKLRIGRDLVVDDFELDFDVGGYDVNTMEIANGLDIPIETDRIRYCLSGKKKLTL